MIISPYLLIDAVILLSAAHTIILVTRAKDNTAREEKTSKWLLKKFEQVKNKRAA